MDAGRTHLWTGRPGPAPAALGGRRYVVRRGATGLRVLVHHPYGRVARLAPERDAAAAPGAVRLPDAFADADAAAAAIARDALRRAPEPEACAELARLLAGPAPRIELDEHDVRALAGRAARVA